MRATALQRKIDKDGIVSDACFNCAFGHWISQELYSRRQPTNGLIRLMEARL
jgi:hypothetical protein